MGGPFLRVSETTVSDKPFDRPLEQTFLMYRALCVAYLISELNKKSRYGFKIKAILNFALQQLEKSE